MSEPTHNIICMWSGAIADIPDGWKLCDGNNDTPDLRNLFLVNAGDTYAVDETGGTLTHAHDFTGDGHSHGLQVGSGLSVVTGFLDGTGIGQITGTTNPKTRHPPYYALCLIMKT